MSGRVYLIVGLTCASRDLTHTSSYVNDSDLTTFPYGDIRLKYPTALGEFGELSRGKGKFQSEGCAFEPLTL